MALMVAQSISRMATPQPEEIPYSVFRERVRSGQIASLEIQGENIRGKYVQPRNVTENGMGREKSRKTDSFTTRWVGTGDELTKFLEENQVKDFTALSEEKSAFWQQLLFTGLPLLFVIFFLFFLMRQLQVGGGKALSFGKSRAKLLNQNQQKVTFKDVAGIDEAKEELEEIIEFLKDPKKFTKLGGRIPKGVLLVGAPGTGKTLLARAIAGEAGVPFFSISGSDFVEMFVGVGASRVRDLFEQGKKNAPCIIFIDEIDAVGRHRGAGLGGGHDEREQTLNQLLVEMDGFESNEGVILISATNRPDVLDPALLRPGRFDRHVVVPRPDLNGRKGILKVHTTKIPLGEDVDLDVLARGTAGLAGADLENLVNESALLAARSNKKKVEMIDFERAKDKILLGKERRSMIISDEEKRVTAYHEAGHTLVAVKIPGADPVHKVTIVPRGMALGLTHQMPTEDKYTMTQDAAETRIAIMMGGRIAEEVVYDRRTTGAGNDIEKATELARKMICEWGMSEKLGPLSFASKDDEIFLAREMHRKANYSEETARIIDQEIKDLVNRCYERGKTILVEEREALDRLAEALLEYEVLDGEEIQKIVAGEPLSRKPSDPPPSENQEGSKVGEKTSSPSTSSKPVGDPEPAMSYDVHGETKE